MKKGGGDAQVDYSLYWSYIKREPRHLLLQEPGLVRRVSVPTVRLPLVCFLAPASRAGVSIYQAVLAQKSNDTSTTNRANNIRMAAPS